MTTKAQVNDIIRSNIHIDDNYPIGSMWKVREVIESIREVMVYPAWYEEDMQCFGMVVFLKDDDYEVVHDVLNPIIDVINRR
ncbi:hypothetical protein ACFVS2_21995 [Brevibacillus sp. NPDC058079]|uniref:hypothetical protein n=1 Tax=Brevibacillus sp. NPDC058079 TaxID=3346330 RepID=UPI0036E36C4D